MLPSLGYKTVTKFVKLTHVPNYILARVSRVTARTGARVGKKGPGCTRKKFAHFCHTSEKKM